jgi:hypothetical protein
LECLKGGNNQCNKLQGPIWKQLLVYLHVYRGHRGRKSKSTPAWCPQWVWDLHLVSRADMSRADMQVGPYCGRFVVQQHLLRHGMSVPTWAVPVCLPSWPFQAHYVEGAHCTPLHLPTQPFSPPANMPISRPYITRHCSGTN